MLSSKIMIICTTTLLVAAIASALPVTFDGKIDGADNYFVTVADPNDPGIDDNLDIESLNFDLDASWFYMGIGVWSGPMAVVGDPTSFLGMTLSFTEFIPGGLLIVTLNGGGLVSTVLNGVTLAEGIDYDVLLGAGANGGLELRIKESIFSPLFFMVLAQLDGTGGDEDDQVLAFDVFVPEPMTMAVLAIGMPLMLIRRRRQMRN